MRQVCEAAVDKETEAAPLSAPAAVCSPQCTPALRQCPHLCAPHTAAPLCSPQLCSVPWLHTSSHTRLGWTHGDTLGHGHQPSSGEFGVYALRTHASDSQGREIS